MAAYTADQLRGAGTPIQELVGGEIYTIDITMGTFPGSEYLTMETVRNSLGYYDSTTGKNAIGVYGDFFAVNGLITSSYISSVIISDVPGGSFTFTPTTTIPASGSMLRGTGGISVQITDTLIEELIVTEGDDQVVTEGAEDRLITNQDIP